jgi:hypothetical protein
MKKIALIIIPVIFLFNACALEIANVIGPGGGYVFYDKGNYNGGWRYIECSPFDIGELKNVEEDSIEYAMELCVSNSGGYYRFHWELPTEAQLKKMLECFSYGLTQFSPDYYYISIKRDANTSTYDKDDSKTFNIYDSNDEAVILHKNFDNKLNGEVEKVEKFPDVVKVRPIRKF